MDFLEDSYEKLKQAPGCLGVQYIRDYTNQKYRDYNNPS